MLGELLRFFLQKHNPIFKVLLFLFFLLFQSLRVLLEGGEHVDLTGSAAFQFFVKVGIILLQINLFFFAVCFAFEVVVADNFDAIFLFVVFLHDLFVEAFLLQEL